MLVIKTVIYQCELLSRFPLLGVMCDVLKLNFDRCVKIFISFVDAEFVIQNLKKGCFPIEFSSL